MSKILRSTAGLNAELEGDVRSGARLRRAMPSVELNAARGNPMSNNQQGIFKVHRKDEC